MDEKEPEDELLKYANDFAREGTSGGGYRAEVFQHQEAIRKALQRGYTWKVVWRAFQATTQTSMCFKTFRRHCRLLRLGWARRRSSSDAGDKPRAFVHSPVPNLDELY